MAVLNMSLITRRRFVQQAAFAAAALYGCPINLLRGGSRFFEARGQKAALLDEATIRKLEAQMYKHAQDLEFEEAARVRDEIRRIKTIGLLS